MSGVPQLEGLGDLAEMSEGMSPRGKNQALTPSSPSERAYTPPLFQLAPIPLPNAKRGQRRLVSRIKDRRLTRCPCRNPCAKNGSRSPGTPWRRHHSSTRCRQRAWGYQCSPWSRPSIQRRCGPRRRCQSGGRRTCAGGGQSASAPNAEMAPRETYSTRSISPPAGHCWVMLVSHTLGQIPQTLRARQAR